MRLLVFVTDAFGGRGGIAKFNRDLLTAMCMHPAIREVVALPRLVPDPIGDLPPRLTYRHDAARSKGAYTSVSMRLFAESNRFDGVVCGHIHLLPLAYLEAKRYRVPLALIIHGVDAWQPTQHRLANLLTSRVDAFVSVSEFTKERFLRWARVSPERGYVVPNCVDLTRFLPGPKRADLLALYHLKGKKIILTQARLSSAEQYKGIDEVLEAMPTLIKEIPELTYVIAGDGDDRPRLERKATSLGLNGHAIFTGYVPEEDKVDYFRLADAFVMPGRGEGFGIVYLEAMACGISAMASTADASREAVRYSDLGIVVDPDDTEAIRAGIRESLRRTNRRTPDGMHFYSFERFTQQWHQVLDQVFVESASPQVHPSIRSPRPLEA